MAEHTTIVCDNPGGKRSCTQPAHTWYIHQPYADTPHRVDLCDQHARALIPFLEAGRLADEYPGAPTKHRHRGIQVTQLRTTPRTRKLKV